MAEAEAIFGGTSERKLAGRSPNDTGMPISCLPVVWCDHCGCSRCHLCCCCMPSGEMVALGLVHTCFGPNFDLSLPALEADLEPEGYLIRSINLRLRQLGSLTHLRFEHSSYLRNENTMADGRTKACPPTDGSSARSSVWKLTLLARPYLDPTVHSASAAR